MLPPALCPVYFASSGACSMRTFAQSTSSSSATIIGSEVLIPCPISGFLETIVTRLSGVMRMKTFRSKPTSCSAASGTAPGVASALGT